MAAIPAVLAVAGAGASIYSGIAGQQAANQSAKLQREQADLSQKNNLANAQIQADNTRRLAARQKLDFLANGLDFTGSAVLTTEDTLNRGQKYVDAITRQGNAQAKLDYMNADVTESKGRASLIGGFGDAATDLYKSNARGDFNGL